MHGKSEFAADDRAVTGSSAAVGDDRRSAFHNRLPSRIGHRSNENIARFKTVYFVRIENDVNIAVSDLFADRHARHERCAVFGIEFVIFDKSSGLLRLNGFRSRLQNKKFARHAVFRPFDVHRLRFSGKHRIMIFDLASPVS